MEYMKHISKVFIFIFTLLLIVGIGQGAPMDATPCSFFPPNLTTPNGYAEVFDYNEAGILGADYYVIEWNEEDGTNISVNTSAIPSQAYIEVGSISLSHIDFQMVGAFKPKDCLNGTTVYNFTIIGYNATDSLTCPVISFVEFEGRNMGIFEIAITTPYMIFIAFFSLIAFVSVLGVFGDTLKFFGGLLGMIIGVIVIVSGISFPIGFLLVGLFAVIGFTTKE